MKSNPISECSICRKIPAKSSANILLNETLPPAAYKLRHGMDRLTHPPQSVDWVVRCPRCGREYSFVCKKDFLDWMLFLERIRPKKDIPEFGEIQIAQNGRLIIPSILLTEMGYSFGDAFMARKTKSGIILKKLEN